MQIVSSGIAIASREGTNRQSLAFARIAVLPDERWIAAARASAAKQDEANQSAVLAWSDDQGQTWSEPIAPFVPTRNNGRPGTFRTACPSVLPDGRVIATLNWQDASNPALPLFNAKTEGTLDMRVYLSFSSDRGVTWSPPQFVDDRPYDTTPLALTGEILVLPDGRLGCQFELSQPYNAAGGWSHSAIMKFSCDGGRTWPEAAVVAHEPQDRSMYWDQRITVMPDGTVLALLWTFDRVAGKYLNIHAASSRDSGRTWSQPWDTGVPGQPAPPVALGDGRVVIVYVDREGEPMLKMRVSSDGGRTFPAPTEALLHRRNLASQTRQEKRGGSSVDAWREMESFSLGLPDTAALAGDEFVFVLYSGPDRDHTDILWGRVKL